MAFFSTVSRVKRQWERNASEDPYWAVLTQQDRRSNRWDQAEFFATGRAVVAAHLQRLQSEGITVTRGRALDFGCGVGRLCRALATEFSEVVGVDVSEQMLAIARKNLADSGNVRVLPNPHADLRVAGDTRFDFIYSLITLQHVPPELARSYIAEFVRLLSAEGVALFQVVVKNDSRLGSLWWPPTLLKRLGRALNRVFAFQTSITMYVVPADEVAAVVEKVGGKIVATWPDHSAGATYQSVTYIVRRRG